MSAADQLIQPCTVDEAKSIIASSNAKAIADYLAGAKTIQKTGYFSTIRFQFVRTGTFPNFVYTCSANVPRVAFGYKTDISLAGAGAGFENLPATLNSTLTQTNLSKPNETRDGEQYIIKGVRFFLTSDSDALLAKLIWSQANVTLQTGANSIFPLGRLDFFPQSSGLVGKGESYIQPPVLNAESQALSSLGNSIEDCDSFFAFPETSPMIWNPSGSTDSMLSMPFRIPADIVLSSTGRAAAPNIAPFVPPDTNAPFSYVDLAVQLVGTSNNNVSVNGLAHAGHRFRSPGAE